MICGSCGTANEAGRKFCGECGARLAPPCPACGAANSPEVKFCGECGSPLAADPARAAERPGRPAERPEPQAERRLVSVLFADLVGFTPLAEGRDAEEVRELLSRYFETARTVIGRHGGAVEKFIGDAVMAVWGAPVAREDDAERASRAALELVGEVAALGAETEATGLRLRAGVGTGEAAVTVGAEGEGMVAGDLVNTAARIQAAASPGTVLVDEGTRRMIEAAIACEDAGEHELKGKAQPVRLWQAVRVTAARRGGGRASGLEAPFVGRDRELRLARDLLHATAEEGRARLLSVVGVAGIGKSRLAWEFEKYVDGLIDDVWWHRGRCLPYGDGVAYWALAEMVRMRARIAEDEEAGSAVASLRAAIEEVVPDAEQRAWIEPRLMHLLGLADRTAPDREDLFSAWRLFFERMAERGPVVLVFEDLQWADAALLDFVEYLLDWSRGSPLYLVTLARPELLERRPTWGAGKRNFTSLYLEQLSDGAMDELLRGLVPGLPDGLRARIRERAEGIPLYAIETVRMLLDRGLLERRGNEYAVTGPVEALEVPGTLHALIAARLDGLAPEERRLLEDASVLGKTFTKRALAAVSGEAEAELDRILASLLRKEVLRLETDPYSPERGQYGFLQALVQKVAYDTLGRRERKARHLRAAAYLESGLGPEEEEIAEVIASHYLEAYESDPGADDAAGIKAKARARLVRAGERAASLAAAEEARHVYEQAAGLADEPLERAGQHAWAGGGTVEEAEALFAGALAIFEREDATHPGARVSARLGEVVWQLGRIDEAVIRMERAFEVLADDRPDEDFAMLAAQLARFYMFRGERERALARVETALEIAEANAYPEVLSQSLNTKGTLFLRRPRESTALLREALAVALEHDLAASALRAYFNLAFVLANSDRDAEVVAAYEHGLRLARSRGDRRWEWLFLSGLAETALLEGHWDAAEQLLADVPAEAGTVMQTLGTRCRLHAERGELAELERAVTAGESGEESDLQARSAQRLARSLLHRERGEHRQALECARESLGADLTQGNATAIAESLAAALDAAFALGDLTEVEELLRATDGLSPAQRIRALRAQAARGSARLAARQGDGEAAQTGFAEAAELFRELVSPFWLGVTLLERAEWLLGANRSDEASGSLQEAREIFGRLRATPWIDRVEAASALQPEASRA